MKKSKNGINMFICNVDLNYLLICIGMEIGLILCASELAFVSLSVYKTYTFVALCFSIVSFLICFIVSNSNSTNFWLNCILSERRMIGKWINPDKIMCVIHTVYCECKIHNLPFTQYIIIYRFECNIV